MNIQIDNELKAFITRKLDDKQVASADELINDALRLMKETEELEEVDVEEMRSDIALGMKQMETGECAQWNAQETKARLFERYRRSKEQA